MAADVAIVVGAGIWKGAPGALIGGIGIIRGGGLDWLLLGQHHCAGGCGTNCNCWGDLFPAPGGIIDGDIFPTNPRINDWRDASVTPLTPPPPVDPCI